MFCKQDLHCENLFFFAVLAEQETFQWVIVGSIFCGYIRAMSVVNQNLTVSEYCQESKLPAALGLNMVTKGLIVLSVGQFLGMYFKFYISITKQMCGGFKLWYFVSLIPAVCMFLHLIR